MEMALTFSTLVLKKCGYWKSAFCTAARPFSKTHTFCNRTFSKLRFYEEITGFPKLVYRPYDFPKRLAQRPPDTAFDLGLVTRRIFCVSQVGTGFVRPEIHAIDNGRHLRQ